MCPYYGQNLAKCMLGSLTGGTHSGGYFCEASKEKIHNDYFRQTCKNNDVHNCKGCNRHPLFTQQH